MDTIPELAPLHQAPNQDRVELSLDPALLARAKMLDGNLSRTLNRALEAHLRRHERTMTDEQIREALDAVNERHETYGVMSDEFGYLD